MLTFFGHGQTNSTLSAEKMVTLQSVRGYWEALRVFGALPRRDQVDPRGMAEALGNVFLIEQIAPGHARLRLAGIHLNDLLGMDARGMPLSALFEPGARSRLYAELEQIFTSPAIIEIWLEAERGVGRPEMTGRMMLLPLTGTAGDPPLALGCIVTDGAVGRQPRRFGIASMVRELLPMPPMRVIHSAPATLAVPASQMPTPPRSSGRPALRLVASRG